MNARLPASIAVLLLAACYSPQRVPAGSAVFEHALTGPDAETQAAEGDVAEDDLVRLALSRSRELRDLASRADESELRRESAGDLSNLELRVGRLSERTLDRVRSSMEVGLRWRPPMPGELDAKRDRLRAQVMDRRGLLVRRQGQLAADVRRLAADLRAQLAMVEIDRERVSLEAEVLDRTRPLLALGEVTRAEVAEAELRLVGARAAEASDAAGIRRTRRRLARLVGGPIPTAIRPSPLELVDLDSLPASAVPSAAEGAYVDAQAQLYLEQLRPWPRLSFVELSYHLEEQEIDSYAELKFGVELPVFDRGGPQIRAATMAVERARSQLEFERTDRSLDIRDAREDLHAARAALKRARAEHSLIAKTTSDWIADPTVAGTLPLRRALLEDRRVAVRLKHRGELAEIALRRALGLQ